MAQKFLVCSIRDSKSETFSVPFFQVNKLTAIRTFGEICKNPESSIARNREDYALFALAEFDDNSGKFEPLEQPLHLISAIEFSNVPV